VHQDINRRELTLDNLHALDAAHARQADVHQQNVGDIRLQLFQRTLDRIVRTDASQPRRSVDDIHDCVANAAAVFYYGDRDDRYFSFDSLCHDAVENTI